MEREALDRTEDGKEAGPWARAQQVVSFTNARRRQNRARVRDDLEEYLSKLGLRLTSKRGLILDALLESDDHPTLEELLGRVRIRQPKVGYSTVYRAMKVLVEGGIAREHQFGEGAVRYEVIDDEVRHDHLICRECGLIVEFEEPLIEELQKRVAKLYKFTLTHRTNELYGRCLNRIACEERKRKRGATPVR